MLTRSPTPTGFINPCLPTPSQAVPDGPRWAFEVKHDGFRFIARREGDRVHVFSRNAKDWSDRVPLIVRRCARCPSRPPRSMARAWWSMSAGSQTPRAYRPPWANAGARARRSSMPSICWNWAATTCALIRGKSAARPLTRLLRKTGPGIRLSEHLDGDGETIFRHACALGAEGIVAKRRDRPYRSGRCADWIKIKIKNLDAPAARVIER